MLTASLIENYLYNLSIANSGRNFRETSTIFLIIITLLDRYPQLTIYLSLHKRCYLSILSPYKSRLSLFTRINIDNLSAATFFECLFKIQYFTVHGQDLLALSRLLLKSYTGVVYSNPKDPQELFDFSHIMINEVIMHMCTELERGLPKEDSVHCTPTLAENYILLYDSITVLTYILKNIHPEDLDTHSFGKEFRDVFCHAIKLILRSLNFILNQFYKVNENFRKVDGLLEDLMHRFNKLQTSLESLMKEQYSQSGQTCYKKYLTDPESPGQAQSSGEMTTLLKALQSGLQNLPLSTKSEKLDETEAIIRVAEHHMKQRALSFVSIKEAAKILEPVISKDSCFNDDQSLEQCIQNKITSVQIIKEYYAHSSQDPLSDPAVRDHELLSEMYLNYIKLSLSRGTNVTFKSPALFTEDSHPYTRKKEYTPSSLQLNLR